MQYGIAVFPSKEVQEFANHYRRRYDPHYSLLEPHLTVKEQEDWDEAKLQAATVHLEQAAARIQPFELTFNRYSSFYPVNHVIYMALSDPEPMKRLHDAICSGPLAEADKPYLYTPHLTIAQQLKADEMHDILSSLKQKPLQLKTPVEQLVLLRKDQDGRWGTVREFKLGNKPDHGLS
ncbi:2'-5' RNA ligase family protein [Paenibacillus filicis]|uniref:2'-5' RNA ligase family protein n=1 Tax=Paenibacillus gyeongsangnamensis TaxID=3388067 RepID=A0ABT4Q342_9BACL|nr:2'-5' RNA ligase family protein [Paenibacillus filicis]MCZ8511298.1 2'-5' RNA ligase family protein [Paenibacillus filicis]